MFLKIVKNFNVLFLRSGFIYIFSRSCQNFDIRIRDTCFFAIHDCKVIYLRFECSSDNRKFFLNRLSYDAIVMVMRRLWFEVLLNPAMFHTVLSHCYTGLGKMLDKSFILMEHSSINNYNLESIST